MLKKCCPPSTIFKYQLLDYGLFIRHYLFRMKLPYFDEIRTIERISNYCSLYLFAFAMLVVLYNIYMQKA